MKVFNHVPKSFIPEYKFVLSSIAVGIMSQNVSKFPFSLPFDPALGDPILVITKTQ
jgi:hypothetical protein